MTAEEIKNQYSMKDIVSQHGFRSNMAGFIRCPFHTGDNSPSMKIYKESFHCFACGANGDIFSFVQKMDNCDFKTAFYSLGGTYQKPTKTSKITVYRAQRAKEKRERDAIRLRKKMELNDMLISMYVVWMKKLEPFSDAWCDCVNEYTKCIGREEELQEEMKRSVGKP